MDIRKAITATEAAAQLGIHRETLRRSILSGRIRAVRPGREYLVDPVSLATWKRGKPGRPAGAKDAGRRHRRSREELAG